MGRRPPRYQRAEIEEAPGSNPGVFFMRERVPFL